MKSFLKHIYIGGILWLNTIFSMVFAQDWFWWQNKKYYPDVPGAKEWITSSDPKALQDKILPKIQNLINRALGLLAFVAIVILIRAGFKMLLNSSDDGEQKKAFATVKNVAIALIFIWCSWLIISSIFRVVWVITK